MEPSIIFGDPEHFAIRCADNSLEYLQEKYQHCHWILGGKIIGDTQEPCYLPLWLAALGNFKQFKLPKILSFEPELTEDVVKAIFITLQKEAEWEAHPVAWESHRIILDETQDAWLLMAHREADGLRFTWQGWRDSCPLADIGRIFSCWVSTSLVMESINECFKYYKVDF